MGGQAPARGATSGAKHPGLVALLAGILVALSGLLGQPASATSVVHSQARASTIAERRGHLVGPTWSILLGDGRERTPSYDNFATGSSVAGRSGMLGTAMTAVSGTSHSYDCARSESVRQPTASAVDLFSSMLSAPILGKRVRPRAPPSQRFLAAEGDVGATEPGWGPGTPAAGQPPDESTIAEILKGKLGSIQRAPLPPGSPAWSDITNMTLSEIRAGAQENLPGYRTILKLLTDGRFNK